MRQFERRAGARSGRRVRHASDPDVADNLLQLYLALGQTAPALQLLEGYCPTSPVGCNDLAINPICRALRADPRFQQLAMKYTTATLQQARRVHRGLIVVMRPT